MIHWAILVIVGLCECGFAFCMGKMKDAAGIAYWSWMGGFIVFLALSMGLLVKATINIPVGTAYPIWTGIGAVGTVLLGIFVFHEPAMFPRLFFIFTLIASIIGLKMVS